jgi:hypothetical protein
MDTLSPAASASTSAIGGGFWLHRSGLRSGPMTLAELRALVASWQILPEDEIEIVANHQRLSGAELIKTARLLEKNPVLLHAESAVLITRESVLAKERVVRMADIQGVDLVFPEPPREKMLSKMDRTLTWAAAILLFWTLLAPILAWYLTRREFKEEGLGMVHGIRLRLTGGEELLVLDGLGVLPPGSERRVHLEKVAELIDSTRKGGLVYS